MRIVIDRVMDLPKAIEQAKEGDTIVVSNNNQRELGERARSRMCPGKTIKFEVQE